MENRLIKNIQNKSFDNLTVKEFAYIRNNRSYWNCECSCGKKIVRCILSITRKKGFKSCGCALRDRVPLDLVGFRKRNLTIVKDISPDTLILSKKTILVICDCGNKREYSLNEFLYSPAKKCGKCPRKEEEKNIKGINLTEIHRYHWNGIRYSAKKRNILFNISVEDAYKLFIKQHNKCALSGENIYLGKKKERTASLDRIDSSKGYTMDNIQWVHKDINKIKLNTPNIKFIDWCKKISNHQEQKQEFKLEYT